MTTESHPPMPATGSGFIMPNAYFAQKCLEWTSHFNANSVISGGDSLAGAVSRFNNAFGLWSPINRHIDLFGSNNNSYSRLGFSNKPTNLSTLPSQSGTETYCSEQVQTKFPFQLGGDSSCLNLSDDHGLRHSTSTPLTLIDSTGPPTGITIPTTTIISPNTNSDSLERAQDMCSRIDDPPCPSIVRPLSNSASATSFYDPRFAHPSCSSPVRHDDLIGPPCLQMYTDENHQGDDEQLDGSHSDGELNLSSESARRKIRDDIKIQPYAFRGTVEVFRCPLCSKDEIFSRGQLTHHLQEHQSHFRREDCKHVCCFCRSELSSNSSLERHLLTHTNHRPFICTYCDKAFTTNGNLSRHVRTSHQIKSELGFIGHQESIHNFSHDTENVDERADGAGETFFDQPVVNSVTSGSGQPSPIKNRHDPPPCSRDMVQLGPSVSTPGQTHMNGLSTNLLYPSMCNSWFTGFTSWINHSNGSGLPNQLPAWQSCRSDSLTKDDEHLSGYGNRPCEREKAKSWTVTSNLETRNSSGKILSEPFTNLSCERSDELDREVDPSCTTNPDGATFEILPQQQHGGSIEIVSLVPNVPDIQESGKLEKLDNIRNQKDGPNLRNLTLNNPQSLMTFSDTNDEPDDRSPSFKMKKSKMQKCLLRTYTRVRKLIWRRRRRRTRRERCLNRMGLTQQCSRDHGGSKVGKSPLRMEKRSNQLIPPIEHPQSPYQPNLRVERDRMCTNPDPEQRITSSLKNNNLLARSTMQETHQISTTFTPPMPSIGFQNMDGNVALDLSLPRPMRTDHMRSTQESNHYRLIDRDLLCSTNGGLTGLNLISHVGLDANPLLPWKRPSSPTIVHTMAVDNNRMTMAVSDSIQMNIAESFNPRDVPIDLASKLTVTGPASPMLQQPVMTKNRPRAINVVNSVTDGITMPFVHKKNSYKDAPKLITCPIAGCNQKFPWNSSLKRHILTHTPHKPFACTRCTKSFSTKSNRERHMERVHQVSLKRQRQRVHVTGKLTNSTDTQCSELTGCSGDQDTSIDSSHDGRIMEELREDEILSMNSNEKQAEDISNTLLSSAGEPVVEPNPERVMAAAMLATATASTTPRSTNSRVSTPFGYPFLIEPNKAHVVQASRKRSQQSRNIRHTQNRLKTTGESLNVLKIDTTTTTTHYSSPFDLSTQNGKDQPAIDLSIHHPFSSQSPMYPNNHTTTPRLFQCHLCSKSFTDRLDTMRHWFLEHRSDWNQFALKAASTDPSSHVPFGQLLLEPSNEQEERRIKTPIITDFSRSAMYCCCICSHQFNTQQDLQRHMRSHTGERPFVCPDCGKEFSLKHSLHRHSRVHMQPTLWNSNSTMPPSLSETQAPVRFSPT